MRLLNDLHFLALHNLSDIQLGSELLFWFHYTQAVKRLIFKDQYIPALKYRELKLPPTSTTKRKSAQGAAEEAEISPIQSRRKSMAASKKTQQIHSVGKVKAQTIDITAELPTGGEIYPGWEFIGEEYETTIQQYVEYMPY